VEDASSTSSIRGLGETQHCSILIAYGNSNLDPRPLMMSYNNEAAGLSNGFLCYLSDIQEERNVCVKVVNGNTGFGYDDLCSSDLPERCFNTGLIGSLWTAGNDPRHIYEANPFPLMPLLPTGFDEMLIRIWNDQLVGHNRGQNDVNFLVI
jgi:hypothetical protein